MTREIDTLSVESEYSSKVIRTAMQTLRPMLGDAVVNAIIHDLELYGLLAANNHELYSIDQIQTALERMFGEAASFLMRPIAIALSEETS